MNNFQSVNFSQYKTSLTIVQDFFLLWTFISEKILIVTFGGIQTIVYTCLS